MNSPKRDTYGSIPMSVDENEAHYDDAEASKMYKSLAAPMLSFQSEPGSSAGGFLNKARESVRDTVTSILSPDGVKCSVRDVQGKATIPVEIINLVKNTVGAGALALPAGVASFANAPSALVGATIWLVVFGAIFAYFFFLIGRANMITQTATYAEAWERTMGRQGSGFVALAVALKAGIGNLECSIILADSFKDLFGAMGLSVGRTLALLIVTLVALLPLCLMKNLAVLAPFSGIGMLAMLITAVAIAIRYFDGSYLEGGQFYDDIEEEFKPTWGSVGLIGSIQFPVMLFLCTVSESYTAHYNASRFWMELKDRSVARYGTVVTASFSFSALYYIFVTCFGFLTFGGACSGMILNNYSEHDILASVSRACVGFSLIFGYPIIFVGFRDAMLDVMLIPDELQTARNLNIITLLLLTFITLLAMVLTDLGVVTAVGGGSLGTIVVFVVPTLMFNKAISLLGDKATPVHKRETVLATILMWIGIFIGVVGTWLALTE